MIEGIVRSLIPEWFWVAISWLPWAGAGIAIVIFASVAHRAYRLGGWPALTSLTAIVAAGAGFILGRRSTPVDTDDIWPHPDKAAGTIRASKRPAAGKPRKKYLLDRILEGLGKR